MTIPKNIYIPKNAVPFDPCASAIRQDETESSEESSEKPNYNIRLDMKLKLKFLWSLHSDDLSQITMKTKKGMDSQQPSPPVLPNGEPGDDFLELVGQHKASRLWPWSVNKEKPIDWNNF